MVQFELVAKESDGENPGKDDHTTSQHLEAGGVGPREGEVHRRGGTKVAQSGNGPHERNELLRAKVGEVFFRALFVVVPHLEGKETAHLSNEHHHGL